MSKEFQQKHQQNQQKQPEIPNFTKQIKKASKLSDVLKPEVFAPPQGWADKIAKELSEQLKTSQLRKVFTEIKNICDKQIKGNATSKEEIYLLYPKLAYSKGRGLMPKEFYELLKTCLEKLVDKNSTKEDFERFLQFFTAIVAYNKIHNKN
ncbi:type III-A CRISPR-associated protein Csm2 [Sulfurihydrogenibium sp.]|uniref:type III-A CRISPR-associated protein Csm2 n=1 Tax=Sulfurihydrogenibium sp. TaxID=2053621 RepID=UPI002630B6DF|nr:type III-A CRISPR-associated protein Csm2 [Sulfurihydrogenibium sp.]